MATGTLPDPNKPPQPKRAVPTEPARKPTKAPAKFSPKAKQK